MIIILIVLFLVLPIAIDMGKIVSGAARDAREEDEKRRKQEAVVKKG